jgi:hypothetical protein
MNGDEIWIDAAANFGDPPEQLRTFAVEREEDGSIRLDEAPQSPSDAAEAARRGMGHD